MNNKLFIRCLPVLNKSTESDRIYKKKLKLVFRETYRRFDKNRSVGVFSDNIDLVIMSVD